jgi:adenosylhomocysteine nucleosidase
METIGLIAAMPQESNALLHRIKHWKRFATGPFRGIRFQVMDRNCSLVTSGMGLKRARDAARTLITLERPQLLVSFGIAGAINEDLSIGDVVIATNACLLDIGLPVKLHTLASLSEAAWNASSQVLQMHATHMVQGTAITTRGSQIDLQQVKEMAHPVLEMETAGIAQIAAEMGVPLISIRSISDGPQSPIPFDLETVLDDKDNLRIGKLLMTIFHSPRIIFQFQRMIRNSRIAADNAVIALVAALSQPSPIISLKESEEY